MIGIDYAKCIKCESCVKVCPDAIFYTDVNKIALHYQESCISCGQCVAVCPANAVLHSDFPSDKVHKLDHSLYPTSQQLMALIKGRRSNRGMSSVPVPQDKIDMILEAAHRAPTAVNSQLVEFTVVSGRENIHRISEFTINTFLRLRNTLGSPILKHILKPFMPKAFGMIPLLDRLKREFDNGNDGVMRKATTVIFITVKQADRYAATDANLAYQNASLMAESLGVAHFYMGFVMSAMKLHRSRYLEKMFGITDSRIYAAIALGMPEVNFSKYIDRKDIKVSFR